MRSFDEKTALFRPLLPPTTGHDVRRGPLSTAFATGVASWAVRRDGGKSRPLKPQFQSSRNAPHYLLHATNGLSKASFRAVFTASAAALWNCSPGAACLTGPAGH